jgi:hypothetical protein
VPSCAADVDCVEGELCRAGRCEARTCQTDGFVCPSHRACADTARNPLDDDRDHGCDRITCLVDADCATLACVNGTCAPDGGTCELPRP